MRIKNKAVVGALGATAVAAAVVMTGSTSAYFFDAEAINSNRIQAGTLDLESSITGAPDVVRDGHVYLENLKPGDVKTVTVNVKNNGSVPGKLTASLSEVVDHEGGVTNPEWKMKDTEETGELDKYLVASINNGKTWAPIADLVKTVKNVPLAPSTTGYTATIQLKVIDSGTAGDTIYMSDIYGFNLDMELKQS